MAEEVAEQGYDYLADLNVKLRDIEEKQNMIKDRILLIGGNLISEKDQTDEEVISLKNKIKLLEEDIRKIRLALQRVIESQEEFARKTELRVLEKQFKMFQPLDLARISDVKDMINQALNKKK